MKNLQSILPFIFFVFIPILAFAVVDAAKSYESGIKAYNEGNYKKAIKLLENAINAGLRGEQFENSKKIIQKSHEELNASVPDKKKVKTDSISKFKVPDIKTFFPFKAGDTVIFERSSTKEKNEIMTKKKALYLDIIKVGKNLIIKNYLLLKIGWQRQKINDKFLYTYNTISLMKRAYPTMEFLFFTLLKKSLKLTKSQFIS
jgi:hypothetical protein